MKPAKRSVKPSDALPITALDCAAVLKLYAQNLDEIRRWHRNASTPGIERGHIVLGEMFFALAVEALTLALDGKSWSPGSRQA